MRALLIAAALVAATATGAVAQRDPGFVARDACQSSIVREARYRFHARDQVQFHDAGNLKRESYDETRVRGRAKYQTKHGWKDFAYGCTYNQRSRRTYNLIVSPR